MKRAPTADRDQGWDWESWVARAAQRFEYPLTPDLAADLGVPAPRLTPRTAPRWALAAVALVVLLFLVAILTVPQVRAAVRDVLRLGGVTIFLDETDTEQLPPLRLPELPGSELGGATTLEAARDGVDFAIPLPSYPPDLGAPDRVFRQDIGGPLVILVWVSPEDRARAAMSLHILGPGAFAEKGDIRFVSETTVHGQRAIWVIGRHWLKYRDPRHPDSPPQDGLLRVVEGHVLIWQQGELTFRLETDLPLDEAVRVAESLE